MTTRYAFVATLCALLCACGGGSSSNSPTTADVQGTWQGSYTIQGQSATPVVAIIKTGGFGFFFDSNGVIYVLPKLTGTTTLDGNIIAYAPAGTTFASGATQETFSLTGAASDNTISGTFGGNGENGTFTLNRVDPFSGTPSVVAGTWQGFYLGPTSSSIDITVSANGTFAGNDAFGCTVTGAITQISGQNLFQVTGTSSGSGCVGAFSGLADESDSDVSGAFGGASGIYYNLGVTSASGAFVAEMKAN